MQIECFYAFEEADGQGGKRWVFAVGDGPRIPIEGHPDSIEFFQHYCRLATAHGLSADQAWASITRKRARELKELEAQAKAEAKCARRDEPLPRKTEQQRKEAEQPAGRSPENAGVPPGMPPRRRSRERGPSRFKQGDIVKAIKAARKAKIEIAAIKIEPDGTILIIPGTPEPVATSPGKALDDWREKRRKRAPRPEE